MISFFYYWSWFCSKRVVKNTKLRKYFKGKVILTGDEPILILFEGSRKQNYDLITKSLGHRKSIVRPYTLLGIKRSPASTWLFYHDIYPRVIWRFFNKTAGHRAKAKRSDQLLWFTFLLFYLDSSKQVTTENCLQLDSNKSLIQFRQITKFCQI